MDSAEWDLRYAGTELVWTAEANRFVVQETAGLKPGRALDLAAGEGRNAVWLAERGWDVTAVDFSAVGLDKGRRLAAQRGVTADWVVADVLEYVPEPAAYDLVLIAYLQLPAADLAGVLRRVVPALAADGTLLIVGHDLANLTEGTGGPQDPAVLYTAADIVEELGGLRVVTAGPVRRPVNGDREAIDTLVRAVRD